MLFGILFLDRKNLEEDKMSQHFKINRLDHFCISARDPESLAKWYREVLGLDLVSEGRTRAGTPMYFLGSANDTCIEILCASDEGLKEFIGNPGHSHICFLVDDFDKVYEYLKSKKVHFREVRDTIQGWKIAYFDDPEGNMLEIMYRPKEKELRSKKKKDKIT